MTVGSCNVSDDGHSLLSLSKSGSTTCASLFRELQQLWDEIGESDTERDKMLLQLEHECLDIYRTKVDGNRKYKAELHKFLAESEAEITRLISALGERVPMPQYEKLKGSFKHQISAIKPTLESLRLKKQERVEEISEIEFQIATICAEIAGGDQIMDHNEIKVDESDLTAKKLAGLKSNLQELQFERNLRLQKVNSHMNAIRELSAVMALDFTKIMAQIHPSFVDALSGRSRSISNEILARLTAEMNSLKQEKKQRLLKVQELDRSLIDLWRLMDTPIEEQKRFDHVMHLITSTTDEVLSPGSLSIDVIDQIKVEVERLNVLKISKMRELIFKRQSELEEIYEGVHMAVDGDKARQILTNLMESGSADLSSLLSSMDDQILEAKEQAQSRKDILDKVEKWRHASEEESWLDEYQQDENRYSAARGVHKNLKRAEKARILISKIPSLVESLTTKVKAWEFEKQMPFLYDQAPLLRTLEEFTISRQEKEEEKRRSREQKKLKDQLATEQEALFGSKPSAKKPLGHNTFTANAIGTPNSRRGTTPLSRLATAMDKRDSGKVGAVIPINYVALPKDERGG